MIMALMALKLFQNHPYLLEVYIKLFRDKMFWICLKNWVE